VPGLQTPWLREELLDALRKLADEKWLRDAVDRAAEPDSALDQVLDFFDDSGALADPEARVGYILRTGAEASARSQLDDALRLALWRGVRH
jgi:hypothetical protein